MSNMIIYGLLALVLWLSIDFCTTFLRVEVSMFAVPIMYVLLFLACACFGELFDRTQVALIILIPVYVAVLLVIIYSPLRKYGTYSAIANTATNIFSGKKVMVIVPHEDDDLNLVSGVINHYIGGGSEVFPVFVTNGDRFGIGEKRIEEAIRCWEGLGVPEGNVFFLGYGDQWSDSGLHIYNASGNEPLISAIGRTETYGIDRHPAYHNGNLYTYNNLRNDLKSIILEKQPDVLFISDYDSHPDHKAVSLISEKVIGEILKEQAIYRPVVYKGYAYSTAWTAVDDYYALNILPTARPEKGCGTMIYDWNDRVRFPVDTSTLSRSLYASSLYGALSAYASQGAASAITRIANSDKVFWQRRTDSLLYDATIEVSSGDGSFLNDFNILDTKDVRNGTRLPYDGVWIPTKGDTAKSIHISLKKETDIVYIYIYDHPSEANNITNMEIVFDDGAKIETGPLNADGTATKIAVRKTHVKSFQLRVLSYEGNNPGIAEIEAFDREKQDTGAFIKIQDSCQNFVYDYIVNEVDSEYTLYSNQPLFELTEKHYSISCDNDRCKARIADGKIMLHCPIHECCTVTVGLKNTNMRDTVVFRNLSRTAKVQIKLSQTIESAYFNTRNRLPTYLFLHALKWKCIRFFSS